MRDRERQSKKAGMPPGSLVHVGRSSETPVEVSLIEYSSDRLVEKQIDTLDEYALPDSSDQVSWISINGMQQMDLVERIGHVFDVHPLTLEDAINALAAPKLEEHETHLFLTVKMLKYRRETRHIEAIHLSLILGVNYLISLHETTDDDTLGSIRVRLRRNSGGIRRAGADYLAYAVLDAVVDHYFILLEQIGDTIEELEDELLAHPEMSAIESIQHLKRELLHLRHWTWPLRAMLQSLSRMESTLIREETKVYFRDVYDHIVQVIGTKEMFRELVAGMFMIYQSNMSNRTNEVMKVLTMFAAVFIPLTFIVGIYGMNFEAMPELTWPWAYPVVWVIMLAVTAVMLVYFRRKKWL